MSILPTYEELEKDYIKIELDSGYYNDDVPKDTIESNIKLLQNNIGKEIIFVLNTDFIYVILKVRLGNYVNPGFCGKFFIDFRKEDYHNYHALRQYPCRCNDQFGNNIPEEWRRIYWGQSLLCEHGTFYILKV